MRSIDKLIDEAKDQLQKLHDEHNANRQEIQRLTVRNQQIDLESTSVAARVNTLMEVAEQEHSIFAIDAQGDDLTDPKVAEADDQMSAVPSKRK